jgi:hypothetical protein
LTNLYGSTSFVGSVQTGQDNPAGRAYLQNLSTWALSRPDGSVAKESFLNTLGGNFATMGPAEQQAAISKLQAKLIEVGGPAQ